MTTRPDDVTRLTARLDELDAALARLTTDLADLTAAVAPVAPSDSEDTWPGGDVPPPAFESLATWVEDYFAVVFTRSIGGEIRWCPQWRDHPEAVTRLEALWRSWETLRLDPNLGIATWLTTFLDPQLAALTGRSGPFAQCAADRHVQLAPLIAASAV